MHAAGGPVARDRLLANLAPLALPRAGSRLRRALERLAADPEIDPQRLDPSRRSRQTCRGSTSRTRTV